MILNEMQNKAVHTTSGPLLILAGAGSGKTRVIVERIEYLINEMGVDPWNILAITFTNKASEEMKERIEKRTKSLGMGVWVSTFHSMCVRILRRYIDRIGYSTNFKIYDTEDAKTIIKQILKEENLDPKLWKEKAIISEISNAKNQFILWDEYEKLSGLDYRKSIISKIYKAYEKKLQESQALDFDDLLIKTVELFKNNSDVLEYYQERFKYIMVDEYQDTNGVQFQLVNMLADKYKNICVVGDDDQSIYKFRGADITNILNFEQVFKNTTTIKLEENYRSTGTILKAANAVIKNNKNRKDKALYTQMGEGNKIDLTVCDNGYKEALYVARQIENYIDNGGDYRDVAILYRTNAQSRLIEEKLVEFNIPYKLVGGVNFYSRKEIKDIIAYLKLIDNNKDDNSFNRIINVPKRGIGAITLAKIQSYATSRGCSMLEALNFLEDIRGIDKIKTKLVSFRDMIKNLSKHAANDIRIYDILEEVIEKTGYVRELELENTTEASSRIENIQELQNKAAAFDSDTYIKLTEENEQQEKNLSGFLEDVALVADVESEENKEEDPNRTLLMTLHSGKGLEFPYVFIIGLEEGLFPSSLSLSSGDISDIEEERRLMYVGITRAKKKLCLTSANKRLIHGSEMDCEQSRFIREIPEELLNITNNTNRYGKNPFNTVGHFSGSVNGGGIKKLPHRTANYNNYGGNTMMDNNTTSFGEEKKRHFALNSNTRSTSNPYDLTALKGANIRINKEEGLGYEVGDRVSHIKFGEGVVRSIEERKRDFNVTVAFDDGQSRTMMAGFAKLTKI